MFQTECPSEDQLVSMVKQLPAQDTWMIIMLGGGHMAAAVFKGKAEPQQVGDHNENRFIF